MPITTYHEVTSTMPGYGLIKPANYVEGRKYPVFVFLHGIGEVAGKKTLKACVDFHYWLKPAADKKGIIFIVPQDNGSALFDDKELVQLIPIIKKYTDGRVGIGGLSRGGGTALAVYMSDSVVMDLVTFCLALCPGNWEAMNEAKAAVRTIPLQIFAGAKDAAVKIATIVNTVDDIIRAGRKDNFYLHVFYNEDHYLWNEVMNAVNTPPITPALGATSWPGTNTVNGVAVNVVVPCVNDPAIDVYDYFLMQWPGNYKPLPRMNIPAPIPAPGGEVYLKYVDSTPDGVSKVVFSDGSPQYFKPAGTDTVSLISTDVERKIVTIRTKGGVKKTFGPTK